MALEVVDQLEELKPASNKSLNPKIVSRLQDHDVPLALVKRELVANNKWIVKPRKGTESLIHSGNHRSKRRVRSLGVGADSHLLPVLNTELLGGQSYPVLTAVLGAAAGPVSGGGALLFSAVSAGVDTAKQTYRVLARDGDEIWHIEEIGKESRNGVFAPVYVSSFFVVDPYRVHFSPKGWLIHEERLDISL